MNYVVATPEIEAMEKKIKPWMLGAGIFKEDTPDEILEMDRIVMEFYSVGMESVI